MQGKLTGPPHEPSARAGPCGSARPRSSTDSRAAPVQHESRHGPLHLPGSQGHPRHPWRRCQLSASQRGWPAGRRSAARPRLPSSAAGTAAARLPGERSAGGAAAAPAPRALCPGASSAGPAGFSQGQGGRGHPKACQALQPHGCPHQGSHRAVRAALIQKLHCHPHGCPRPPKPGSHRAVRATQFQWPCVCGFGGARGCASPPARGPSRRHPRRGPKEERCSPGPRPPQQPRRPRCASTLLQRKPRAQRSPAEMSQKGTAQVLLRCGGTAGCCASPSSASKEPRPCQRAPFGSPRGTGAGLPHQPDRRSVPNDGRGGRLAGSETDASRRWGNSSPALSRCVCVCVCVHANSWPDAGRMANVR